MQLVHYTPEKAQLWDEFIVTCPMATFLHSRKFLSYHKDRFQDLSLMVYDESANLIACLPAAQSLADSKMVVSHPGISFGGILHKARLLGEAMIHALQLIKDYYLSLGYTSFQYKAVPTIYHQITCDDDLYALFRFGAKIFRRDLSSVINIQQPLLLSADRASKLRNLVRKAEKNNVVISNDKRFLKDFWQLLTENLQKKYEVDPVHTLAEIMFLLEAFPEHIQLRVAVVNQEVLAGSIVFVSSTVLHTQYLAVSMLGKTLFALDFLIHKCIDEAKTLNKRYFSFGSSTEQNGHYLNQGLYQSKIKHGASGVTHDFYEVCL